MRIIDWSSDVCSSDLDRVRPRRTIGREDRESVARRPLANGDARLEDDTALVAGVARQNAIGITIGLGETVAEDCEQAAHEKRDGFVRRQRAERVSGAARLHTMNRRNEV